MKKIIFIFIFYINYWCLAFGQIDPSFNGCKLGKSTKAEVVKTMKAKGVNVKDLVNELLVEPMSFAGYQWDGYLEFYKDTLSYVGLNIWSQSEEELKKIFRDLKFRYGHKYSDYKIIDSEESFNYDDENISIKCAILEDKKLGKYLSLTYLHLVLNNHFFDDIINVRDHDL